MEYFVSIIALVFTVIGIYFSEKSHHTKICDDIYTLLGQLHDIRNEKIDNMDVEKTNFQYKRIADVQLQIKHLLIEADKFYIPLSIPQLRLLADSWEELLHYSVANSYWEKCLSKSFRRKELEAEYYRRYAHFLYRINEEEKGNSMYQKAIGLPQDNDDCAYMNIQTISSWICDIFDKINSPGYTSIHSNNSSEFYFIHLVRKLLKEMFVLSGKIKNTDMRAQCYDETKKINYLYNKYGKGKEGFEKIGLDFFLM